MFNFDFKNPTKLIFGRDTIQRISQEIPHGSKVLLLYGAGSIKQNGVYDEVVNALSGFSYIEFGGIPPNPEYDVLCEALQIIKSQ